ncbi:MAG: tyrosine-type recombinase/integrase [Tepidisphaeraceae bacterium]
MRHVHAYIAKKRSPFWKIFWRLRGERRYRQRGLGVRDKQVAEKLLADFVREKEDESVGLSSPCSVKDAAGRPLVEHLCKYVGWLRGRGRDPMYVYNVDRRLRKLFEACGWRLLRDVSKDGLLFWLDVQSLAVKTRNDYAKALVAFFRWLVQFNRLPFMPVQAGEVVVDARGMEPRRRRRALTDAEFGRLLDVSGGFRCVLLVAAFTGLRRSELLGLRWGDVRLDALRPFLLVRAANAKNKTTAKVPLRADLVSELRGLRASSPEGAAVFASVPGMREWRRLLGLAGVAYFDEQGRQADFHALRKTFNTNLARGGVTVDERMALMRVSDARLVAETYMDSGRLALGEALEKLPRYGVRAADESVSTGTGGQISGPVDCPVSVGFSCPGSSLSVGVGGAAGVGNRSEVPADCGGLSSDAQNVGNWGTRIRT